jgi:uncharacterized protein involved in type VI secretion and phage assembly
MHAELIERLAREATGASGRLNSTKSCIQLQACGATFNAKHHPPPDDTIQAAPQDAR